MTTQHETPRPIRVCLITETYFPVIGGGETQARALVAGLRGKGFEPRVVTRRSDAAFPPEDRLDQVPITRLKPAGPGQLKKWKLLPRLLSFLSNADTGADVFLVSGYRVLGIAAVIAGRRRGIPVVLKADNSGEFSGEYFRGGAAKLGLDRFPWLVDRIVNARNRILRRADAFVSLSSDMRAELEAHGIPPERIVQIPNSVDHVRFRRGADSPAAERDRLGLPREGPVVVFTGRLLETKGVMDLARVWKSIAPDYPAARLIVVGGGGGLMYDCEAELHAYLAANGLAESVVTTGYVRNVEDYLKAADIFAFPTRDEAFGISLVEAMAAGLAVVATKVGGIPDIVDHEENGLLIDPSDEPRLEAALRRLLDDAEMRARLGRAAVETVERRYTTDAVVAGYVDLLERLVSGRDPGASR